MEYRGLSPTSASYSSVIESCCKAQQWDIILQKMDRMRDKGLIPDGGTYNAAVRACAHTDKWKKAVRLLQEMHSRSYAVDQITFNVVMSACSAAGEWQQAVNLLRAMSVDGNAPPEAHMYNAAAMEKAAAGQWEHTLNILAQMARTEGMPVPMVTAPLTINTAPAMLVPSPPMLTSPSCSTFSSSSSSSSIPDQDSYFSARSPVYGSLACSPRNMLEASHSLPSLSMASSLSSMPSGDQLIDTSLPPPPPPHQHSLSESDLPRSEGRESPRSREGDDEASNAEGSKEDMGSLFAFDWIK